MALNLGGALKGGLGGAAGGAALGPWGAAGGGVLGALAGLFSPNEKERQKQAYGQTPNRFSPEQQGALSSLLKQGQTGLQNPTAGFEPIEQQARSKFQRETIPGLAERFTYMGGSDTRGSSDFAGMLGGAQSEFDQGLAALKAQYGQQGQQNALQMLQAGLQPQNEQIYFGQSPDVGGGLLEAGGNIFGNVAAAGGFGGKGADAGGGLTDEAIKDQNVVGQYSKWNPTQKSAFAKFIQSLMGAK